MSALRKWANGSPDIKTERNKRLLVYAILLIIPAINLSSMTQSRLRQRVAEIGVRRSFGSTRGKHYVASIGWESGAYVA